jgi:hypothetical protein
MCEKVFETKEALMSHMKVHRGGNTCTICGKWYKRRKGLRVHMAEVHMRENEKKFVCKCGKRFGMECLLRVHEKTCVQ